MRQYPTVEPPWTAKILLTILSEFELPSILTASPTLWKIVLLAIKLPRLAVWMRI